MADKKLSSVVRSETVELKFCDESAAAAPGPSPICDTGVIQDTTGPSMSCNHVSDSNLTNAIDGNVTSQERQFVSYQLRSCCCPHKHMIHTSNLQLLQFSDTPAPVYTFMNDTALTPTWEETTAQHSSDDSQSITPLLSPADFSQSQTKETTSLLMKEIDELRTSGGGVSRVANKRGSLAVPASKKNSTQVTSFRKASLAASSHNNVLSREPHQSVNSNGTHLPANGPSAHQRACSRDHSLEPQHQSMARAIYQAVKDRKKRKSSSGTPKKSFFEPIPQSPPPLEQRRQTIQPGHRLTNGHANGPDEIQNLTDDVRKDAVNDALFDSPVRPSKLQITPTGSPQKSGSPLFSRGRLKDRFQLDLRPSVIRNSLKDKRKQSSGFKTGGGFVTVTGPSADNCQPPSVNYRNQDKITKQTHCEESSGGYSGAETLQVKDRPHTEHQLIALNSSLLQVQDKTGGLTAVEDGALVNGAVEVHGKETPAHADLPPYSPYHSSKPSTSHDSSHSHNTDDSVQTVVDMVKHINTKDAGSHELPTPPLTTVADTETATPPIADSPKKLTANVGGVGVDATEPCCLPECCSVCSPGTQSFLQFRQQYCTSYRLKVELLRNPVDCCILPNEYVAVADYDNGMLVLNPKGDIVQHRTTQNYTNACGVVCACPAGGEFRLFVLVYREGHWCVNIMDSTWDTIATLECPNDAAIEPWALRKIVIAHTSLSKGQITTPLSPEPSLYLLASGETKSCIWLYDFGFRAWQLMVSENSRKGAYNDLSVRWDPVCRETHFLLCDWKKAQLSSVVLSEQVELVDTRTIRMRRVKGQEWIVQGPKLAQWDEHADLLVYDGSGKLFLFEGDTFKCKKVVGDVGKGEVSALTAKDGWCYALCRYKLCIDAFLYRPLNETFL